MPKQYSKRQRDRAVRMAQDHLEEYDSPYLAYKAIAPKVAVGVDRCAVECSKPRSMPVISPV